MIIALVSISLFSLSSRHEPEEHITLTTSFLASYTPGHQTREAEGELEAKILLEVTAEVVTVQVVQNLESFSAW